MRVRVIAPVRFVVALFGVCCCALVFACAPSLAAPPAIEGQSFSDVGSGSATLNATVNAGGSLTGYQFEYGTSEAYGSTTPLTSLGATSEGVGVLVPLGELKQATTYHFRVVATNASDETTQGADVTFTTLPLGILGLPDGRVFEMVTPPNNTNADVYVPQSGAELSQKEGVQTTHPFQAAADGDAVAYAGAPTVEGSGKAGAGSGNEDMATRSTIGEWSSRSIQPAGLNIAFYEAFSSDLSVGFLSSPEISVTPAPPIGYRALYEYSFVSGEYRAMFTTTPPNRKPEEFHTPHSFPVSPQVSFAGASSDLSHVLFEANDALTQAAELDPPSSEEADLYDSVNGQLSLVNVLPDGDVAPNSTFGQPLKSNNVPESEGSSTHGLSHVISADGSRVFWTRLNAVGAPEALYVRENDTQPSSPVGSKGECTVPTDACTVQVDASQAGGVGGGGLFWTASSDGSEVFFSDSATAGLTASTVPGSGQNLYMYEVASGRLADLTSVSEAGVEGVAGASEDGQYIYFVATGVLSEAPNARGALPAKGADNLYVLHQGEQPKFIGTLSAEDGSKARPFGINYNFGVWQPGLGLRTAEVDPDGHQLVFMSDRSLTGYDNKIPGGSKEEDLSEVYLYDAEGGQLTCVSCSPSGERPVVNAAGRTVGREQASAAYVPVSWSLTYQSRWISEDGNRVFFDSANPLVPQDTNGNQDVYEWEREGSGSCREAPGCVYLISGGTSESASWLLDASTSGNDVFIASRGKLAPQDGNENFDVYDARVGGIQLLSPPVCTGTGCQGVPGAPPIFATPSSVTFSGVGNFAPSAPPEKVRSRGLTRAQKLVVALKRCKGRRPRSKRAKCEARARKSYAVKSHVKTSKKGRK